MSHLSHISRMQVLVSGSLLLRALVRTSSRKEARTVRAGPCISSLEAPGALVSEPPKPSSLGQACETPKTRSIRVTYAAALRIKDPCRGVLSPAEQHTNGPLVLLNLATGTLLLWACLERTCQRMALDPQFRVPYKTTWTAHPSFAGLQSHQKIACIGTGSGLQSLLSAAHFLHNQTLHQQKGNVVLNCSSVLYTTNDGGSAGVLSWKNSKQRPFCRRAHEGTQCRWSSQLCSHHVRQSPKITFQDSPEAVCEQQTCVDMRPGSAHAI